MQKHLDESLAVLREAVENFPWDNKEAYANFMAQTYYYVFHSVPLLAFAAGLMKNEDEKYRRRFFSHIQEETNHDKIALNDLKALGYKIEDFPELPQTRMMWETQYYKIQHRDPMALMGHVVCLEYAAPILAPLIAQKVSDSFGKGEKFIKFHGEEDAEHIEDALKVLDTLSEDRLKLIIENLEQTTIAYAGMLEEIKERLSSNNNQKIAA